jgi:hypothetical protein
LSSRVARVVVLRAAVAAQVDSVLEPDCLLPQGLITPLPLVAVARVEHLSVKERLDQIPYFLLSLQPAAVVAAVTKQIKTVITAALAAAEVIPYLLPHRELAAQEIPRRYRHRKAITAALAIMQLPVIPRVVAVVRQPQVQQELTLFLATVATARLHLFLAAALLMLAAVVVVVVGHLVAMPQEDLAVLAVVATAAQHLIPVAQERLTRVAVAVAEILKPRPTTAAPAALASSSSSTPYPFNLS